MRKLIFNLAIATSFLAAIAFTGCQSPDQKAENAEEIVADAQQNLEEAKQNEIIAKREAAQEEEWKKFRAETDVKIQENEAKIAELRDKMKASGKKMDAAYAARIDELEKRNAAIREWMDDYEKTHSDWEAFKQDFNRNMDEIGEGLKNLTVDTNNKQL